jgi:VWFA-related protein
MRTTRLVSALLVAGALSVLGLTSLHAQSTSPPPQQSTPPQGQQPTFRSTTDVVAVDVSVVDKDGRPVDNLRPEDFTLKVDGKGRRLTSAEFVSLRHQDDEAKPSTFSTNQGERPGRLIMIVIDESNIHKGTTKNVFTAASTFVDNLNPSDRVAVQLIPGSGPLINFTSNHVQVKSVLESAAGQSVEADDTGRIGVSEAIAITDRDDQSVWNEVIERECAGVNLDPESVTQCQNLLRGDIREVYTKTRFTAISTLLSLRQIIGRLGLTPEPKTLVLISEGLVVERNLADTSWIGPETAAAQVSIYGIRLSSMQYDALMGRTSPTREQDKDLLVEGMERIVAEGRGAVMPVAGNPNVTFAKLSTELSGYYLLSFEPTGDDRDGKTHQIGVDVARKGVYVRARKEFSAEPAGTKHTADQLLTDTLRSALIKSDFGLKLTSYSLRDEKTSRIKLMIGAEIDRTFEPTGPIALAYYVSDASGALVSADVVKNLAPEPGQSGQPQLYMAAVSVDPGTYSIKLAAADADGRVASVERSASAKLTAVGQVRMGDLLIARPNGTGGVRPTVDGVVGTDAMVGYLELYSDAEPQLEQSKVTLEIAQSDSGTALTSAPMPFADNKPGRRIAEAAVPVGLLANGDYVARAVLSQNGRTIGTITQPFRVAHDASHAHSNGPAPAAVAHATPIAMSSRIDHFDRAAVLTRPVVGFFLDHLGIVGLPALPESLTPAVGLARAGQFTAIPAVVASVQTPHFAAPFLNGLAAFAAGDLKGAAALFGDSIKLAPTFYPAAFYLGACYAAAGQDADATKTWELSLVKDPAAPWFYTLLSDSMLRQHQVPQALEILKAAAALWPADDDITLRLGTALSMDGRPSESLDVLDAYFTRHADDSERLLLAMRMIYDARSANQPIQTIDADRARFAKYYEAYSKIGGADLTQAQRWKAFVDRSSAR